MRTLIVIPAYNEEYAIESVIDRVRACHPEADMLVVNDGSTDQTAPRTREKGVNLINHPCNLGVGGAMQTGFFYALRNGYDLVCQLDGDGQHHPAEIHRLTAPIRSGRADLVIGSRFITKQGDQSSVARRIGITFLSALISLLSGKRVTDATSGFRAMNRKALRLFAGDYAVDYPEPEMLILAHKNRLAVKEIPVAMLKRRSGTSSIGFAGSAYYMSKVTLAVLVGALKKA